MNYGLRRKRVMKLLNNEGISQMLIQNLDNIYYFSGFNALVTSRPMGLVMTMDKAVLIVPRVAEDSAIIEAQGVDISVYYEHPAGEGESIGFYACLTNVLSKKARSGKIGVEAGKLSLFDLEVIKSLEFQPQDISQHLHRMRSIKEAGEIEAIRLAAKYVDTNLKFSFSTIRPEVTEIEIDQAGLYTLNQAVAAELPAASVSCFTMSLSGVKRTTIPHTYSSGRKMKLGDAAVFCRQVAINGYRAQCDRTAFLSKPGLEKEKYVSLVQAAHDAALEVIRPGIAAAEVDKAIRDVFARAGVEKYFVHRAGSGFGIGTTELPHLSFDSKTQILANMVLVIQPALYIPGIGGFRYSDTILVKENDNEVISNYPKDIKHMTILG